MKLYVKQMYNWNCYAYCAEEVDPQYWDYFKSELWWQLGNHFIKTFDNVEDFSYCAENFARYGETSVKQYLKILPVPWKKALNLLISEMKKIDVDWFIYGSTAMALLGIEVEPKDINISIANYSDFDKVRNYFYKLAIQPFQRCDNWVASGLGRIFLEANIGFSFRNEEPRPYDMSQLDKVSYHGQEVYVSTLEMLKQDNQCYGRPERAALIEEQIKQNQRTEIHPGNATGWEEKGKD